MFLYGRHGDLMASALVPGLSSLCLSPSWGHSAVSWGKTLYYSTSVRPSVQRGASEFNTGATLRWTIILSRDSRNIPSRFIL